MTTINVTPSLLKGYNTTVYSKPDVTVATAWNTGTQTLFTVTGAVLLRIYGVVTTLMVSTANSGTLSVGFTGSVTAYLGTTTVNGTNFILNSVWVDTAPTVLAKVLVAANLTWALASNSNVLLTIATNNMTAGGMNLYCDWVPVSSGASVV